MASVTVTFSLDSDADRALLTYLDGLPRGTKSATIRDALQAHLQGAGVTLVDVYQVVKSIERKFDRGLVVSPGTGQPGQPAEDAHPGDVVDDDDILGTLDGAGKC